MLAPADEVHRRLLDHHLQSSGLLDLLTPAHQRPHGVLECTATSPGTLRADLAARGWIEDRGAWLLRRRKPWVRWSARQPHPGPALHLEAETGSSSEDCFSVHVDLCSPGSHLTLVPLHWWVDSVGWARWRPLLVRVVERTIPAGPRAGRR